ncbi:hypothetical protein LNV09_20710 [Paucibacter sp. B2R-40]|uniref:hypothetical protein n=1 Tax=Paucibacter sp. B2R-40 TaxID=2893554 RepID=UPI0021E39F8F|nr:hypothetical protein [Paucibacter sp. B2R-40]MCV2356570.1 hypothetical protein [Paucibacter sp. B2R-40]
MTWTPITVPTDLHAFLVAVEMRPQLSKAQRRRFFGQMRRALRAKGCWSGSRCGLCLVASAPAQSAAARHATLNWLIDQQELSTVHVHVPRPLHDYLTDFPVHDAADDKPLEPELAGACRNAVRQALIGALLQRRHALGTLLLKGGEGEGATP